MRNADKENTCVLIIEVPKVAPLSMADKVERRIHTFWQLFRYSPIVAKSILPSVAGALAIPIVCCLLSQRLFWPEFVSLFVGSLFVIAGVVLTIRLRKNAFWILLSICVFVLGMLLLAFLLQPRTRSNFDRVAFIQEVERNGGEIEYDELSDIEILLSPNSEWLQAGFRAPWIPNFVANLLGGEAMFGTLVSIDIPSDLITERNVEILHSLSIRYNVNVSDSAYARSPSANAVQKLFQYYKSVNHGDENFDDDGIGIVNITHFSLGALQQIERDHRVKLVADDELSPECGAYLTASGVFLKRIPNTN